MIHFSLYHTTTLTLHFTEAQTRRCTVLSLNPSLSYHRRRHHRRNLLKKPLPTTTPPPSIFITTTSPSSSPSSDQHTLHLQIPLQPPNYLTTLLRNSKLHFTHFLLSSKDAFQDLKTLIKFENQSLYSSNYPYSYKYSYSDGFSNGPQRVVVSCKRSTVEFIGTVLISSFVIFYAFSVISKLGSLLFPNCMQNRVGEGDVVFRRDRSLGGKLVAVGTKENNYQITSDYAEQNNYDDSSWHWGSEVKEWERERGKKDRLPKWWPQGNVGSRISETLEEGEKEEYQKMANRVVRAIMDNRLRGKDISEGDVIQLRRICKTYGVKALIDTANTRDSFYRTSLNFILDYCEKQVNGSKSVQIVGEDVQYFIAGVNGSTSVQIDGEDVQYFIAGLADNIGLEDTRAVRMVSAAVAARTRSRFLQAWALEMQGKHSEAVMELLKVCFIHQIFPPEENSEWQYFLGLSKRLSYSRNNTRHIQPEMEMVARGLENHLKVDQRETLMNTLTSVCGEETPISVLEALGFW